MNLVNEQQITGCRLTNNPTMSRGRSKAGALVTLHCTPISSANTMAMVVLPKPGGP